MFLPGTAFSTLLYDDVAFWILSDFFVQGCTLFVLCVSGWREGTDWLLPSLNSGNASSSVERGQP